LIAEHALSNISAYIFKLKRGQAIHSRINIIYKDKGSEKKLLLISLLKNQE
jgi:hypothetical protein